MTLTRKLLVACMALGIVGPALDGGTFASFSASTTNADSTFATGSIVLSNEVVGGTACLSTGGGSTDVNANDGCDAFFSSAIQKPGDVASAQLILTNEGNLPGTISGSALSCVTNDVPDMITPFHGDGDLCGELLIQAQEFTGPTFGILATVPKCMHPVNESSNCGFGFTSIDDFVSTTTATPMVSNTPVVAPGTSRYVRITIWWLDLGGSHNQFQGRQAEFDVEWTLVQ